MRTTALLVAAAAAALFVAPAAAEPVTVRIAYGDLDLRDPAAVKQLRVRSARAIHRACRAASRFGWNASADRTCEETAIAQANLEIERRQQRVAVAGF